ncbi:MAG: hypothetical protein Q9190_004405 [Brigantiaea leucoxantha]
MFGSPTALILPNVDNIPREPPKPPTPLDFPQYQIRSRIVRAPVNANDLPKLFAAAQNKGLATCHLEALNFTGVRELSLERLLPATFLPPQQWQNDPATLPDFHSSPTPAVVEERLSNGQKRPGHADFHRRCTEVLYENDDAFNFLQRKPAEVPIRIAYFRKFWDNLLLMAEYWDTSLDNDPPGHLHSSSNLAAVGSSCSPSSTECPSVHGSKNYIGRRIGTGREMPATYRDDAICRFVETIAWQFGCRVEAPRQQPRFKLQGHIISMHQTASVYRTPKDRNQARRNILEGPLLAIQCRNTTAFRKQGEQIGEGKDEIRDLLMNEIGVMLMIAQKRAREAKVEVKPWEGAWYVTKPRWGGGSGGEIGEAGQEDAVEDKERPTSNKQGSKKQKRRHGIRSVEHWKNLTPNSSLWENGVTYLGIGKEDDAKYDEVFLRPPTSYPPFP